MGYLAIVLSAVLAAIAVPALKLLYQTFTIESLLAIRFGLALVISLPLFLKQKDDFFLKGIGEKLQVLLYGFISTLTIYTISLGLRLTSVAHTNVIMIFIPVLVAIGSITVLKEKVKALQIVGMALGFFGVLILILDSNGHELTSGGSIRGNVFVLIASILSSGNILFARHLSNKFSSVTMAYSSFVANIAVHSTITVYQVFKGNTIFITEPDSYTYPLLLFLVVFCTVIMFFAYQYGIKYSSAFFAGLSNYMKFPLSVYLGVLIFGDLLSRVFYLAAILVLIGSFLASNQLFHRRS